MIRPLCNQLFGAALLVFFEGRLDLLDEREHVAHAEDAARHPVGMERLELVELLAGTGEENRLADDFFHRQRGTAARVAVDLGEDHAVETDRVVERLGDVHRFLTGHRVDDEQRVLRFDGRVDRVQLVHQIGVDLQTTGGVDDHEVATEPLRFLDCTARNADRIGRLAVERNVDTPGEHAQLLDGGRALQVGTDEQRLQALRFQQARQLPGRGRLSGTLQTGQQQRPSAASGSSSACRWYRRAIPRVLRGRS